MVKVTIEDDRCKNEITGEFFMGLMSRNGLSVPLERCIKPSLAMLRQWQSLPSVWMMRSTRHLRRMRVRSQMK